MAYDISRAPIAVILATGAGQGLASLAETTPSSLMAVGGSSLLERMIRNCLSCGISQFVVVLGHRSEQVKQYVDKTFRGIRVTYVVNDRYRETDACHSLLLASKAIGTSDFVKFNADLVFDVKLLRLVVESNRPDLLCMDRDLGQANRYMAVASDEQMQLVAIGPNVDKDIVTGVAVGIEKFSPKTAKLLFAALTRLADDTSSKPGDYEATLARLAADGVAVQVLDISGLAWASVANKTDLQAANVLFDTPVKTQSRSQQRAADEAVDKQTRHLET